MTDYSNVLITPSLATSNSSLINQGWSKELQDIAAPSAEAVETVIRVRAVHDYIAEDETEVGNMLLEI